MMMMVDLGTRADDDGDAHEVSRELRRVVVHYRCLENRLHTVDFGPSISVVLKLRFFNFRGTKTSVHLFPWYYIFGPSISVVLTRAAPSRGPRSLPPESPFEGEFFIDNLRSLVPRK